MAKEQKDRSLDLSLFELPPTPDVIPLAVGQRLVAIGDIHGSMCLLNDTLLGASIMDIYENWIGGNAILVQVGDVLDRADGELACWLLLCKLARQARDAGGSVVLLWGNHEVSNAIGDFRLAPQNMFDRWTEAFGSKLEQLYGSTWKELYTITEDDNGNDNNTDACHRRKKVEPARIAAMEPGGLLSQPLLSKLKIAVKVGRTVLVHAGLTVQHTEQGIEAMNQIASAWIVKKFSCAKKATIDFPLGVNSTEAPSPLWIRYYSRPPDATPKRPEARSMVEDVLKQLDVDRMVVGHSIQNQINSVFDGKVWRIDIGCGIPLSVQKSSGIGDPSKYRREALEVSCVGPDDEEKVSVVRRIRRSYAYRDFEIVRYYNR